MSATLTDRIVAYVIAHPRSTAPDVARKLSAERATVAGLLYRLTLRQRMERTRTSPAHAYRYAVVM